MRFPERCSGLDLTLFNSCRLVSLLSSPCPSRLGLGLFAYGSAMTMVQRGHYLSLSLPRRVVNDMLHFAHRVPGVPVERLIDVRLVRDLRKNVTQRLGWCT